MPAKTNLFEKQKTAYQKKQMTLEKPDTKAAVTSDSVFSRTDNSTIVVMSYRRRMTRNTQNSAKFILAYPMKDSGVHFDSRISFRFPFLPAHPALGSSLFCWLQLSSGVMFHQ